MVKDVRITFRKRHSYNTSSNKYRMVKTPGGKLTVHYITRKAKGPICAATGKKLSGIPAVKPTVYARMKPHQRTVARPYGGVLCASAVRERIMRAFIIEEQKIVKKVLIEKLKKTKAAKSGAAASA